MHIDDEFSDTSNEIGSDELLSDDSLRLPESANLLVRIHAVRAWLNRQAQETTLELGEAALSLQQAMQGQEHLRRRERAILEEKLAHSRRALAGAQQRLATYEEAQALLLECIDHTSGERVLVEYYLALEELMEATILQVDQEAKTARMHALSAVQHRVEHVGAPNEEE